MTWSYNAGKRGRNWVRSYWDPARKAYFLEWREGGRRVRQKLSVTTEDEAERKADALAGRIAEREPEDISTKASDLTIERLITIYLREVNAKKKGSVRKHGERAGRVWRAYFGEGLKRHPRTLDRTDWDNFRSARADGTISGWERPVDKRQIQMDLAWLVMIMNWATGANDADGKPYLERNPWSGTVRKAQGWVMPRNKTPSRKGMPSDIRQLLHEHAPNWQFKLALQLERETRHRNASIRQLFWEEVDLVDEIVHWVGEKDKAGRDLWVPLTREAVVLLKSAPSLGSTGPVFPSRQDPKVPSPEGSWHAWLQKAKKNLLESIEEGAPRERMRRRLERVGYHSEKREGVRDPKFRELSPIFQETMSGTNYDTLRRIYDDVSTDELRSAIRDL